MTVKQILAYEERGKSQLYHELGKMALELILPLAKSAKKDCPDFEGIIFGMGGYALRGTITYVYHEEGFPSEEVIRDLGFGELDKRSISRQFYPKSMVKLYDTLEELCDSEIFPNKDIKL